jgi:aerobic carbon-monoxide dehydrogenase medium subunit
VNAATEVIVTLPRYRIAVAVAHFSDVIVPTTTEDAVAAFGDGAGVTVLAGGTIVMPELKLGRLQPARTLFLGRAGLDGIARSGETYRIGAMTPIARLVDGAPEPLASFAAHVADYEIRGQATIGGNLCAPAGESAPRGDLQAPLLALGARVRSAGAGGERTEPVDDFLAAGGAGRLVLEIEVDAPKRSATASVRRPHAHSYSILAVAVAETAEGVRIAVHGAGPGAARARSVERALAGGASTSDAARKVLDDVEPNDDALASGWYRREVLPGLVASAIDDLS